MKIPPHKLLALLLCCAPLALYAQEDSMRSCNSNGDPEPTPLTKGKLIYSNDFASSAALADWHLEGEAKVEFKDGWMHMFSPDEASHHVFWCPQQFPASFVAEWEAQNLDAEWGLCIVFFAATGVNGEDIMDPSLPLRNGEFTQYIQGAINSYHISYYAHVPHEPNRGHANLRKNNMFALLQSGQLGIPIQSADVHQIRLIKDDGHIRLYVDGRIVIDYLDTGLTHGPVYGAGKIGFRQMRWTHFRYRNFRVWELGDDVSTTQP